MPQYTGPGIPYLPILGGYSRAASTPPPGAAIQKKVIAAKTADEARAKAAAAQAKAAAAKAAKDKGKNKPPTEPDAKYKWNLPPHSWSLPLRPNQIEESMYGKTFGNAPETYRRGRMWWYANANNTYTTSDGAKKDSMTGDDRKYGFQFLWNPESFSTSVSLNTEVTPNPLDRFVGVAGAFPSGETISLSLRLDRTNDFACMRNLLDKQYSLNLFEASPNNAEFSKMATYYKSSFFKEASDSEVAKNIKNLMELGTIADIEYIYKAVNGPKWKSISGRETSDIGYLAATLLRIDIGPLSYVGYINSMTVNHIAFSQDMTPIRTDLQLSLNLMASAGIASDGTAAAVAPKQD